MECLTLLQFKIRFPIEKVSLIHLIMDFEFILFILNLINLIIVILVIITHKVIFIFHIHLQLNSIDILILLILFQ